MFPNGRPLNQPHNFIGYSHPIGMPENEARERFHKCEHMIDHCQDGIEKCFGRIEQIDSATSALTEMYKDITLKVVRFQDYLANKAIKKKEQKRDNIFEFIPVDHKGKDDIRHIRNALYDFYCWILDNVQENRERSIAITKLEECAMWLNKSISRRKDNEA